MKRFLLSLLLLCAALLSTVAVVHQRRVQMAGVGVGLPDPTLDARPPLMAVNVALEQYDAAGREQALNQLGAFAWLRQRFDLAQADWEGWDVIIEAGAQHQKHFIAVLVSARPLPADEFARVAGQFAARYSAQVEVYQIGDEVNLKSGWHHAPPSAAQYTELLQASYAAIHAADSTATVLAAALAPTTETGSDNLSELIYLQQLYDLGAGKYFDGAAGKPYGFYSGPADRQTDPALLNFSRFVLLRQVMERNGDAHKLLWAGNFGWNTRADSAWGYATPEQQAAYTLAAYDRAAREWPWAGALALESYQPPASAEEARWGFALADEQGHLTPLGNALQSAPYPTTMVGAGNYPAQHPAAQYTGAWKFSDLGADIPEDYAGASVTFAFQGTDFALRVRRADYRAHLYVTIDGAPANALPTDEHGAYLILTSPTLAPMVDTVTVARGLDPSATHIAVIQPERGWAQWALVGFAVGQRAPDDGFSFILGALMAVMLLSAVSAWRWRRTFEMRWFANMWARLGEAGQVALTAIIGTLLAWTTWLTFGDDLIAATRRFGEAAPLALTALTAGLFYFSPSAVVALFALVALLILFYLRLDLALAFVALTIPFFLQPRLLWQRGFSLVEIGTLFAILVWSLRHIRPALLMAQRREWRVRLAPLDGAMLAFGLVATLSLFIADLPLMALREYRLVIVEPLLFYFVVRATPLSPSARWRIVDAFVLGAVLMAAIGLWQYATGTNLITAEGGVQRLRSVYGSPNNVALYLGRVFPIAIAVVLLSRQRARRIAYAVAALIMGLTLVLTFSKGALFIGIPAALAVIVIGWQGKRGAIAVGLAGLLGLLALPLLAQIPRFADLLSPASGTGFFRLKLWQAAWRMFLDHPLLGVGLDNFLYHYRGHYILPEAWQEPNLSHPHNWVLDYLTRLGALGLASGLALQAAFWRTARNAWSKIQSDVETRALAIGLMASMVNFLAHGLVDNSFFLVDLAFAFCLAAALMQGATKDAPRPGI